jgi:hypothetical protein
VRHNTHKQSTNAIISHPAATSFCDFAGEKIFSSTPKAARTMTMEANVEMMGVWMRRVFE